MLRSARLDKLLAYLYAALLLISSGLWLSACNAGSSALPPSASNPAPVIASLSQSSVTAGAAGLTLTITGSGFVQGSIVQWNQSNRITTFVSSSQLQVALTAADLASSGNAQIEVVNPAPGGGTSSPIAFTINNPVPQINSLSPASVTVGGTPPTLTVSGAGFSSSSVVQVNGVARSTTYVNSSALTATLTTSDVASPGTEQVTVYTGPPGGGTSAPVALTIYPVPSIISVSSSSIIINSPYRTLSIEGSGFTTSSTFQVNGGSALSTTWSNPSLLYGTLPAADLTSVGPLSITVSNPSTPPSNAVTINVTPYPVPALTLLSPGSAAFGSAGFTLTALGSNFVPASVVQWNGSPLPTTFVSDTQITAAISAADIQNLGNNMVAVFNPLPGGGLSSASAFTTYLSLAANDLLYNSHTGLLYASVAGSGGPALGNSIVSIDPYTGKTGAPIFVGSEPGNMALSDDGTTLWVAFRGSPSARKIDLMNGIATAIQPYFPGPSDTSFLPYATSLALLPGSTSSFAVAAGPVMIYDDDVPRPNNNHAGATLLAFGANSARLYGYFNALFFFTVDGTGIASAVVLPLSVTPPNINELKYDSGRLYLDSGAVLDGVSGGVLGTFAPSGPVSIDSSLGRAFTLNFGPPNNIEFNQITAFDLNTFVPVGSFPVGGIQNVFNGPSSLVRWGEDGLAFRSESQVYILRSSLVADLSGTPADVAVSLSAPVSSVTGSNTPITVNVTNNGPKAASGVNLSDTFSPDVIFVSVNPSQGSCSGTPVVRCNLGSLPSGATATLTLVVLPTLAGNLTSTATVSATQPDPDIGNNTASFTTAVTGPAYNAVPILASISPPAAPARSSTLTLTVNGSNFSSGSAVAWNGSSLPTTLVNSGQLTATVDVSLLAAAGFADVAVNNSSPGGGLSASLPFTILQSVALDVNDLAFDPFTRKIYASVPSTASQVTGNSIVSIDPLTGVIGAPINIGSEPTRLVVSDDGHFLYVTLLGSNAVRRMDLTTLSPGTQFTLGNSPVGAFAPKDLAVMPGNPNVLATAGDGNGVQVWDVTDSGATSLMNTTSPDYGGVLAWGSPTNLYAGEENPSAGGFTRFTVGATSFARTDSTNLDTAYGKITYSGGLVYTEGGGVMDPSPTPPAMPRLVGTIRSAGGNPSAADATINRVFYLNQNYPNVTSRIISAFDASHFTPAGSTELDGLAGDAFDLIRWGADGLAFVTAKDIWGNGTGRVVLLHGPAVLPRSSTPNPAPSVSTASPSSATALAGNTWVTITGSNFVPGSIVEWNGSSRTTVFVNSGQLRVAIPAADLATPQIAAMRVFNPAPGGGSSSQISFKIN
jgi:hypothetical protein